MTLTPGTRLGIYEVEAQIGEGGMGQVYSATDTKLKRRVAIKILPPAVAADADRLARFRREAEILASLNHPRIGAIYGIEESSEISAFVMELAAGEPLNRRIARGPIPADAALAIAVQIAEALEAAHEKGLVHRDLKPANIIVTDDGDVKVLDFGIAKALDANRAEEPAGSPTITAPALLTEPGMILGTVAYMSPEQARGRPVDTRTDIWAFGCVLFEMLTGRAAFVGDTRSDTMAAVLTREPDWPLMPPTLPSSIRRVLRKCLEKDPRRRLRNVGDARMEIEEAISAPAPAEPIARRSSARLAWLAGIIALVALVALGVARQNWRGRPVVADAVRLSLPVPGQFFTEPPSAVLSPDGRRIAFISADASGKRMLWVRELDSQDARVLPGTDAADLPFWSGDGSALGFFADSQLKRVDTAGGPVQVLASAPVSPGATWNSDGIILFSSSGELRKVLATGGAVSTVLKQTGGVQWPHFLPDNRHFLYRGWDRSLGPGVYVGSLDSSDTARIMTADFEATYAPPGYLLFVRQETLMAQPFDATRLALTGEPAVVAVRAWVAGGYGHGVYSAGANGALAYVNADISNTQLAWFDRGGRPLGTVGPPGRYDSPPQLSPRGTTIAVARGPYFQQDLWFLDPRDGTETRFTFDPPGSRVPVWSPDGSRIFFQAAHGDGRGARLYEKAASGAGAEVMVADLAIITLQDVSPDGRLVVYLQVGKQGHFELWTLPLVGDRRPAPFLQTNFNNGQAKVSPDGRWIAYTSNESGRDEVYVQSFPTAGSKRQISVAGGAQPRWKKSGGELFYLAPDQMLMSVPVKGGELLEVGRPAALFRTRLEFLGLQGPNFMAGYDVTTDGERFLISAPPEQAVPPINILLNWTAVLNKK